VNLLENDDEEEAKAPVALDTNVYSIKSGEKN